MRSSFTKSGARIGASSAADTYRAVRPALQDGALHVDGESIALIPANAARISAAVAGMRKAARPQPAKPSALARPAGDPMAELERRCPEILAEFDRLAGSNRHRHALADLLVRLQTGLDRVQLQI